MEGGWEGRELRDSRTLDLLEPDLLSTLAADNIFAFVARERGKIYGGDYWAAQFRIPWKGTLPGFEKVEIEIAYFASAATRTHSSISS